MKNRISFFFSVILILIFSIISRSQNMVDISQLIANRLSMPAESIRGIKLAAMNSSGEVCGQFTSYTHPSLNTLFVLRGDKTGKLTECILLGEFVSGQAIALTDRGDVVFHMKYMTAEYYTPFIISCENGQYEKTEYGYKYNSLTENNCAGIATGCGGEQVLFIASEKDGSNYIQLQAHDSVKAYMGQSHVAKPYAFNLKTRQVKKIPTRADKSEIFYANVSAMNKAGQYCGTSQGFGGKIFSKKLVPFYKDKDTTYMLLQGLEGFPSAMNDRGEVVGVWFDTYSGKMNGFYWNKENTQNDSEGWVDLGKGKTRLPAGINNKGIVAGNELEGKACRPFLYKAGKLYIMKDLFVDTEYASWNPEKIYGINDKYILMQASQGTEKKMLRIKIDFLKTL